MLTNEQGIVIGRILVGTLPWIPARRVKKWVVDELVEMGIVARWSRSKKGRLLAGGPFITLTPWGAVTQGVWLVEDGLDERPRWCRPDEDKNEGDVSARVRRSEKERSIKLPGLIPDPDFLLDEGGDPMELFGAKVRIDPRLGRGARGGGGKRVG